MIKRKAPVSLLLLLFIGTPIMRVILPCGEELVG